MRWLELYGLQSDSTQVSSPSALSLANAAGGHPAHSHATKFVQKEGNYRLVTTVLRTHGSGTRVRVDPCLMLRFRSAEQDQIFGSCTEYRASRSFYSVADVHRTVSLN